MDKKYLIVNFINSDKIPTSFSSKEWPLHLTLLAHFNTDKPVEQLVKELDNCTNKLKSFEVLVKSESLFGPNSDVPVSVLQSNKTITELHTKLMCVADNLEATYDETNFVASGYKPHVSTQRGIKLNIGQATLVDSVTLVEVAKVSEGKLIKVIRTFHLNV